MVRALYATFEGGPSGELTLAIADTWSAVWPDHYQCMWLNEDGVTTLYTYKHTRGGHYKLRNELTLMETQ